MNKFLKPVLLASFLALALPGAVQARQLPNQDYSASAQPSDDNLQEHGTYTNKDGKTVHSPAHTKDGSVPPGASAKCRDGSYSFSQHRSGTCSGHGGVADWL